MKNPAGIFLLIFLGAITSPAELRVTLTKVDDGDLKTQQLEAGGAWNYGIKQDDAFTLLRSSVIRNDARGKMADATVKVDRSSIYQTMSGYGAAMTDSSAFVLSQLKSAFPEMYAFTMKRLFSSEDGAGFSVLRLAVGASDYVATPDYFTCCDHESPDLRDFDISRDKQFIIPILKDALRLNPQIRIIATPWSAPAWMRTNGRLTGVSSNEKSRGATCRLKPGMFGLYADYLVRFIEAYQNEGIRIDSITLQNEPQNDQSDYPCMRMDEEDQIRLVKQLGPKLAEKSLKTRLLVHDHNWVLHPNDRTPSGGDVKQAPLESVTRIFSDPEAGPFIHGSAWHVYAGSPGDMARVYDALHKQFPNKEILTTEQSGWGLSRGAWWGDVDWGLRHNWMAPLAHWSTTSLQWNLALDRKGGPTPRTDSKAVGLVTIDGAGVRFEREFYPMAQLSRAAPPGARRIATQVTGGDIDAVSFLWSDGKTSLVLVNRNKEPKSVFLDGAESGFTYQIPGRGIATLVW